MLKADSDQGKTPHRKKNTKHVTRPSSSLKHLGLKFIKHKFKFI